MAHSIPLELLNKLHLYNKGKVSRAEIEEISRPYAHVFELHFTPNSFTVRFKNHNAPITITPTEPTL